MFVQLDYQLLCYATSSQWRLDVGANINIDLLDVFETRLKVGKKSDEDSLVDIVWS